MEVLDAMQTDPSRFGQYFSVRRENVCFASGKNIKRQSATKWSMTMKMGAYPRTPVP
jgi:hypothetical protein